MNTHRYKLNDRVIYRGGFGTEQPTDVIITGIGFKNDKPVYDLDNGHWCYESQIVSKTVDDDELAKLLGATSARRIPIRQATFRVELTESELMVLREALMIAKGHWAGRQIPKSMLASALLDRVGRPA